MPCRRVALAMRAMTAAGAAPTVAPRAPRGRGPPDGRRGAAVARLPAGGAAAAQPHHLRLAAQRRVHDRARGGRRRRGARAHDAAGGGGAEPLERGERGRRGAHTRARCARPALGGHRRLPHRERPAAPAPAAEPLAGGGCGSTYGADGAPWSDAFDRKMPSAVAAAVVAVVAARQCALVQSSSRRKYGRHLQAAGKPKARARPGAGGHACCGRRQHAGERRWGGGARAGWWPHGTAPELFGPRRGRTACAGR